MFPCRSGRPTRGVWAGFRPPTDWYRLDGFARGRCHGFPKATWRPAEPPSSSCCRGKAHSPPPWFPLSPNRTAGWLFVGPQEPRHFGTQQFDEGPREHLLGFLGCVFEVVLWVCQYVEEGLDQLLVLQDMGNAVRQRAGRGIWFLPKSNGSSRRNEELESRGSLHPSATWWNSGHSDS